MKFKVKISAGMTVSENGKLIIRVPRNLRAELGIHIGEFITLERKKENMDIKLQVEQGLHDDVESDSMATYVSADVFDTLKLSDVTNISNVVVLKDEITLGTDPEYYVIDNSTKEIIHPGRWFEKYGGVGYDGMLAEIRPVPALNAKKLTSNISYLLRKANDIIKQTETNPNIKMVAGSYHKNHTAGFHLHYGLLHELLQIYNTKRMVLNQLVRTLDYYVGVICVIPEGLADSSRRCAPFSSYGKVGDYRVDHRTLEYRVPGGSLLRHPILAEGLIGLGALVVDDVVSRLRAATNDFKDLNKLSTPEDLNDIYPHVPNIADLFQTMCVPHISTAMGQVDRIHTDLQKMISYSKRKASIDMLFNNLETPFSPYLEENWALNEPLKTLNVVF